MEISIELHNKKKATIAAMQRDRLPHWTLWRELANYYLPRRYTWLLSGTEASVRNAKNPYLLDGTGTMAARTLASGMMNGITSPSRPWFRLRIPGFDDDADSEARMWLDEVARRMLLIMAESNFYNAIAVMYLDLDIFGTAAMLIYEDYESVIRCYNPNLGEFYIAQSDRLQVNTFAREFTYKVHQVEARWGRENLSDTLQNKCKQGGAQLQDDVKIVHLIEPNTYSDGLVDKRFQYREIYWEEAGQIGRALETRGYHEMPGLFPRWELSGNDPYGASPAMDALGDVIQLQHETKKKAQGLDKLVSPPMVADIQLKHQPTALMPNGLTFVSGLRDGQVGMRPAYQIQVPLDQLSADIMQVQQRIREIFHNPLFMMISQLDTVRSATEIDARREEKLVMLGSVLERFENEALDPAIRRVYGIMNRMKLLPPAPESLQGRDLEIQYVSILSSAQSAVGVIPTERWLTLIGQTAAIYPDSILLPNWDQILRDYGRDIGVPARGMNSQADVEMMKQAQQAQRDAQQAAVEGQVLVDSAKTLSETDVGGGANALQQMIGGYSM
jgi:hypothetical protein